MIRVPIKKHPSNIGATDVGVDASILANVERALAKSERFVTVFDPDVASVKFDREKTSKLVAILKKLDPGLPEEQVHQLLDVARRAWFELNAVSSNIADGDRKTFRAKREEDLLRGLATAADNLRAKWDEINSHPLLTYSLHLMLSAKMYEIPHHVELPNESAWWRSQFKGMSREYFDQHYEKLNYAMENGLIQIGDAAAHMADDIKKAATLRNSEQYRFVLYLASAWKRITGTIPSVTRNIYGSKHTGDANKKGKLSPFERFATSTIPSF